LYSDRKTRKSKTYTRQTLESRTKGLHAFGIDFSDETTGDGMGYVEVEQRPQYEYVEV
jgi:hypothetical protein